MSQEKLSEIIETFQEKEAVASQEFCQRWRTQSEMILRTEDQPSEPV